MCISMDVSIKRDKISIMQVIFSRQPPVIIFFCITELIFISVVPFSLQVTITGPLSPLQSPALYSRTWWTRFCLMRNSTLRFSENAQPQSVRWTERTALLQRRRRKKRDPQWSMVWEVRGQRSVLYGCTDLCFFSH